MAEFDYEVVDGRKIRVRPQEVVSEIDENGYFVRQPNHFTEGFGEGKNPVEKGRYHLVWAKLCHWSNRASIVRELLGLEDAISVNMVDHVSYSRNIGPCKHRLVDYPNLWGYARDLYQIPAFRHNTYFKDFAASVDLNEADEEYWENTYYDIVVQETDWDTIWKTPTRRESLSKDPAHKFKAEK